MSRRTFILIQILAVSGSATACIVLLLSVQARSLISPWLTLVITAAYLASVIWDGVSHQAKSGG